MGVFSYASPRGISILTGSVHLSDILVHFIPKISRKVFESSWAAKLETAEAKRFGGFILRAHEEFRSLHDQYPLRIFLFGFASKTISERLRILAAVCPTHCLGSHMKKLPFGSFFICEPTRIRTSVNGFGDRYSTTEL